MPNSKRGRGSDSSTSLGHNSSSESPVRKGKLRHPHKTIEDLAHQREEVVEELRVLAADPDDPPLLFDWNSSAVEQLRVNIARLPADGAAAPPSMVPTPATADSMKTAILCHLVASTPNASRPTVIGGTVGLACSLRQSHIVCGLLRGLELDPWFAAVAGVAPLGGHLAAVYIPRPKVANGACDTVPLHSNFFA